VIKKQYDHRLLGKGYRGKTIRSTTGQGKGRGGAQSRSEKKKFTLFVFVKAGRKRLTKQLSRRAWPWGFRKGGGKLRRPKKKGEEKTDANGGEKKERQEAEPVCL